MPLGLEETDFVLVSFRQCHHQRSLLFLSAGGRSRRWGSVSVTPTRNLSSICPWLQSQVTHALRKQKAWTFLSPVGVGTGQRCGRAASLLWRLGQDAFLGPRSVPRLRTREGRLDVTRIPAVMQIPGGLRTHRVVYNNRFSLSSRLPSRTTSALATLRKITQSRGLGGDALCVLFLEALDGASALDWARTNAAPQTIVRKASSQGAALSMAPLSADRPGSKRVARTPPPFPVGISCPRKRPCPHLVVGTPFGFLPKSVLRELQFFDPN